MSSTELRPERLSHGLVALTLGVIVASALYRFSFADATFFLDEIWVIDVVRKGRFWAGLPQPPLFFFTAVLAESICGAGERCLRLPAAFFALLLTAVPVVALRWSRDLTGGAAGALVWTTLLAFSSPIVFYGARLKQYPAEALSAALILASFLSIVARPGDRVRWRTYFVLSVLFVPLTHATPFVLLGTGIALVWLSAMTSGLRSAGRVLTGHVGLGLMFATVYGLYLGPRPATTAYFGDLHDYFRSFPVYFDGSARFVVDGTRHWVGHLLNLTPAMALLAAALLVWSVTIVRRRDVPRIAIVIACVVPPAGVLAASALEAYTYGEVRLMIFCAPGLFLLLAMAAADFMRIPRVPGLLAGFAVAVFLIVFVVREVAMQPYNSTYMQATDQRATYAFLEANHRPGVPIVCRSTDAVPLLRYLPALGPDLIVIEDKAALIPIPHAEESWFVLREAQRPAGAVTLVRGTPSVMRLLQGTQ